MSAELELNGPGIELRIVDEIQSTSEALVMLAVDGAPPQALMARRQVSGRGRRGRVWVGLDGNLFLSVLLRPLRPVRPGHWSLLVAVAVADLIGELVPEPAVRLKWPNDVILGDGKLAGILIDAGQGVTPWLVIGIGINLVSRPEDLGREVAVLTEHGPAPPADVVARRLVAVLQRWQALYESVGFEPIRQAWLRAGHGAGAALQIDGGRIDGRFAGLDDDGALLIDTGGIIRTVMAGEVAVG